MFFCAQGSAQSLQNQSLQLELTTTPVGSPQIQRAVSMQDGRVIFEYQSPYVFMGNWGPHELSAATAKSAWEMESGELFERARFPVNLANGIRRTHVVELVKEGTLFRLLMILENNGDDSVHVDWYPVWKTTWDSPGARWMKGWNALTYEPFQNRLSVDAQIVLGSRVHSSDRRPDGHVPYWIIGGEDVWLNFSLEWCGGWKAELSRNDDGIEWSVWLPQEETQLVLAPGEKITGPVINIVATSGNSEMAHRAEWVRQRATLAEKRFGGPPHGYMLVWNHWYSIEFDVNHNYLLDQLPLLNDFGFDAFVIDAGWYTQIGDWSVNTEKFTNPVKLKSLLDTVKTKEMYAGLWSCPQFGRDQADGSELYEEPKFYRPFLSGAQLYDLYGMNFEQFLVDHVDLLVNEYGADWWKYDQDFFARHSRHGLLKNVEEFQRGLLAVRKQFPDLYIENCQSGGRMVNDLTTFAADIHWLRDGGDTGYHHARSNIAEVLGAMQFLPGWTCQRWNNRWHENDPTDDELTKLYCRSAMPGVWGISEDLSKVDSLQLAAIRYQVELYRKLNQLKTSGLWEIHYPYDTKDIAAITFYNDKCSEAALLVYRWNAKGELGKTISLDGLDNSKEYLIRNIDTNTKIKLSGQTLARDGLLIRLGKTQLSALYFIKQNLEKI